MFGYHVGQLLVGTFGVLGLGCDGDMSYVADTSQSFTSEAIGGHGRQIVKGSKLAGSEAFTYDGHIRHLSPYKSNFPMKTRQHSDQNVGSERSSVWTITLMPWPLSWI